MKNKGFTLIELLAVIVILAVIALIAIPLIADVIEKAKVGSAESSALGYMDAVEKQVAINKLKKENEIVAGEYTKEELDLKQVKIKGEIKDARVVVDEKGAVTQGRFCIDDFSLDYDGKGMKISENNYCNGDIDPIVEICTLEANTEYPFDYTGDYQTFTVPCTGNYKVELWGAQGYSTPYYPGGLGAYTSGTIKLRKGTIVHVYVGGEGVHLESGTSGNVGGYNGGGHVASVNDSQYTGGGGGATDIRILPLNVDEENLKWDSEIGLKSRIMVAAGGGSANSFTVNNLWLCPSNPCVSRGQGGSGGGLNGNDGFMAYVTPAPDNCAINSHPPAFGHGGTQTVGGVDGRSDIEGDGLFGKGGSCISGAGGGWYGGGGGGHNGAGGGSSYISGHEGCIGIKNDGTAISDTATSIETSYSYTGYKFTDTIMIDGDGYQWTTEKAETASGMPQYDDPTNTVTGKTQNGYAKITFIGKN